MSQNELRVDFCSHEAAKYAVMHWHYSKAMPKSKLVKFGAWENGEFIGSVIFGVGATADLVKRYGLTKDQGCELVRVALRRGHIASVTRIIGICIKLLKHAQPGLRLVVSFADPEHGHTGRIYQAGNWIYTGRSMASDEYLVNGKRWHGRAFRASKPDYMTTKEALTRLDPNYQTIKGSSKYRYLYPLDRAMRKQLEPLAKPYPKHAGEAKSETHPTSSRETGGANPTRPLSETEAPAAVAAE